MKYAGHTAPDTFANHYQPNNSGADGQGSFLQAPLRNVSDHFRGLTIQRNLNRVQKLPAAKQRDDRPDYAALNQELSSLKGKNDSISRTQRSQLVKRKTKLYHKAFHKWQTAELYTYSPTDESSAPMTGSQLATFERVRFLTPERDRLASAMLQVASIRSPTGRAALQDLVALCGKSREVEVRPGLERWRCLCGKLNDLTVD